MTMLTTRTTRLTTRGRAVAVIRLARPWFWPLGWGGAYFGSVVATGSLVPPVGSWPAVTAALVVLGPLVWTAVLTVNDLYDLPTDRRNPRKTTAPLVTGVLTADEVTRWHFGSVLGAVAVATVAGPVFLIGTVLVLALGWLYSMPPVRLKARPGADVAVNALVVGVLGPLAGWCLHRDVTGYPPMLALLGVLLAAGLYLPTTVLDRDADAGAGIRTAAVRWSVRACYRAGVALWVAASAVWLTVCHLGVLIERDSWTVQNVTVPLVAVVYATMTRRPTIGRMAVVTAAFAIPATDFLLALA